MLSYTTFSCLVHAKLPFKSAVHDDQLLHALSEMILMISQVNMVPTGCPANLHHQRWHHPAWWSTLHSTQREDGSTSIHPQGPSVYTKVPALHLLVHALVQHECSCQVFCWILWDNLMIQGTARTLTSHTQACANTLLKSHDKWVPISWQWMAAGHRSVFKDATCTLYTTWPM